jgi:copper(I)-binding protein
VRASLTAALVLLAIDAAACPGLEVTGGWVREPPPGSDVAAAFMHLSNTGDAPLRITRVTSPTFGHAMLHETITVGDRVRMIPHDELVLAPRGSRELAPGSLHLMLMHAVRPPVAGDTVEVEFACGATHLLVPLPVRRDLR